MAERALKELIMERIAERKMKACSGMAAMIVLIVLLLLSVAGMIAGGILIDEYESVSGIAIMVVSIILFSIVSVSFAGLKAVKPNEAAVFSLFGKYAGTIREAGFYFVNPFAAACGPMKERTASESRQPGSQSSPRRTVSLKVQTLVNDVQKVNDKLGNPVMIGAIVVWRVSDPTAAVFAVDNYMSYISNQSDSIIRNVARLYPYDSIDDGEDGDDEMTLRGSASDISEHMKNELQDKVRDAGLEIMDVRINQLSYAQEIASAMLQRQQAVAVIAARKKIVEGAVSMVQMALDELKKGDIVELDEERKAQMVSNLLVVLCGNKDAQPIVNSGSIY